MICACIHLHLASRPLVGVVREWRYGSSSLLIRSRCSSGGGFVVTGVVTVVGGGLILAGGILTVGGNANSSSHVSEGRILDNSKCAGQGL